jgi:hypothetical protein
MSITYDKNTIVEIEDTYYGFIFLKEEDYILVCTSSRYPIDIIWNFQNVPIETPVNEYLERIKPYLS